jgi:hypothetical protein
LPISPILGPAYARRSRKERRLAWPVHLSVEGGDLLVAARGNDTEVRTANESIWGAYIALDLYLVRPEPKRIHSEYLRTVLELPASRRRGRRPEVKSTRNRSAHPG